VVAIVLLAVTMQRFEAQLGLHPVLWGLNWCTLLVSLLLPPMMVRATDDALLRLVSLFVGWGTPYMMLSVNYETLFLLALFAQVCCQESPRSPMKKSPE
jgi:hypothetical protein